MPSTQLLSILSSVIPIILFFTPRQHTFLNLQSSSFSQSRIYGFNGSYSTSNDNGVMGAYHAKFVSSSVAYFAGSIKKFKYANGTMPWSSQNGQYGHIGSNYAAYACVDMSTTYYGTMSSQFIQGISTQQGQPAIGAQASFSMLNILNTQFSSTYDFFVITEPNSVKFTCPYILTTIALSAPVQPTITCTAYQYSITNLTNMTVTGSSCQYSLVYWILSGDGVAINGPALTVLDDTFATGSCCNCAPSYYLAPEVFIYFNSWYNQLECYATYLQIGQSYNILQYALASTGAQITRNFTVQVQGQCESVHITPPTFSTQYIYIVGSSTYCIPDIFGFSIDVTCCQLTYSLSCANSSVSAIYTFNSTAPSLCFYTQLNSYVSIYTFALTASVLNTAVYTQSSTIYFDVNVTSPCYTNTFIVNGTVTDYNLTYKQTLSNIQLPTFVVSSLYTYCGRLTYNTAVVNDGTDTIVPLNTFYSFTDLTSHNPPQLLLNLNYSSSSYAGEYTFSVSAYQGTYISNIQLYTFTVILLDACNDVSLISNNQGENLIYFTNDTASHNYILTPFSFSSSLCTATIDYALSVGTCINGKPFPSSNILVYLSISPTYYFEVNNPYIIGISQCLATISGSSSVTTNTVSMNIWVIIVDGCQDNVIYNTTSADIYYDISNITSDPIVYVQWTTLLPQCGNVQFVWYDANWDLLADNQNAFFITYPDSVDNSELGINVTNPPGKGQVGDVLVLNIQGYVTYTDMNMVQQNISVNGTMTLHIVDNCNSRTVIKNWNIPTYTIYDPTTYITFTPWTTSPSYCGPITSYTFKAIPTTQNIQSTSIFVYDSTSNSIAVQTNQASNVGYYTIILYTTLKNGVTASLEAQFFVAANCSANVITPYQLASFYSYNITSAPGNIQFGDWSQSYDASYCGPFVYSATYENNGFTSTDSSLYPFVSFYSSNQSFGVYSEDFSLNNFAITITLTGCVQSQCQNISFVLELELNCFVSYLVPDPTDPEIFNNQLLQNFTLYPDNSHTIVSIANFTQQFSCLHDTTYTIQNVTPSIPISSIVFGGSMSTVNSANQSLILSANSKNYAGSYVIFVNASVPNFDHLNNYVNTTTGWLKINVTIEPIAQPSFVISPMNQQFDVGSDLSPITMILPGLSDQDPSLNVSVASVVCQGVSFIVNYPEITFYPSSQNIGKSYQMIITLTDNNTHPLTQTYQLTVRFTQTQQQNLNTSNQTNSSQNGNTSNSQTSPDLTATIKQVSIDGIVEVNFNQAIYVPTNWSSFNESVLNLILSDNAYQKMPDYGFTWNIISFSQLTMNIQITWNNPGKISSKAKDTLKIQFIQNCFFRQAETSDCIDEDYTTNDKFIPKQLRYDGKFCIQVLVPSQGLKNSMGALMGMMQGTSIGSFSLNIFMQARSLIQIGLPHQQGSGQ